MVQHTVLKQIRRNFLKPTLQFTLPWLQPRMLSVIDMWSHQWLKFCSETHQNFLKTGCRIHLYKNSQKEKIFMRNQFRVRMLHFFYFFITLFWMMLSLAAFFHDEQTEGQVLNHVYGADQNWCMKEWNLKCLIWRQQKQDHQ